MNRIEVALPNIEPWIGLAHVRPAPGRNPLGDKVKGAYVQMVALATSAHEFEELTKKDLLLDHLILIDLDDVATVDSYRLEGRINHEIDELVKSLSESEPVRSDIFSPYTDEDA